MSIRACVRDERAVPAQTVRATVIGAGAHTLSLSGSTIWLEGVPLPLRNLPVAIPQDAADLPNAGSRRWTQLDPGPRGGRLRAGASRFTSGALRHLTDRN